MYARLHAINEEFQKLIKGMITREEYDQRLEEINNPLLDESQIKDISATWSRETVGDNDSREVYGDEAIGKILRNISSG